METLALWFAIGVLYGVYRYLTEKEKPERFFWLANGLYFGVCFVHERYMVLVALLLVTVLLLLKLRPTSTSFWLTLAPPRSVLSRLSARSPAWV